MILIVLASFMLAVAANKIYEKFLSIFDKMECRLSKWLSSRVSWRRVGWKANLSSNLTGRAKKAMHREIAIMCAFAAVKTAARIAVVFTLLLVPAWQSTTQKEASRELAMVVFNPTNVTKNEERPDVRPFSRTNMTDACIDTKTDGQRVQTVTCIHMAGRFSSLVPGTARFFVSGNLVTVRPANQNTFTIAVTVRSSCGPRICRQRRLEIDTARNLWETIYAQYLVDGCQPGKALTRIVACSRVDVDFEGVQWQLTNQLLDNVSQRIVRTRILVEDSSYDSTTLWVILGVASAVVIVLSLFENFTNGEDEKYALAFVQQEANHLLKQAREYGLMGESPNISGCYVSTPHEKLPGELKVYDLGGEDRGHLSGLDWGAQGFSRLQHRVQM